MSQEKKPVQTYLPEDLINEIDRLAGENCRSRTGQIEHMLRQQVAVQGLGREYQNRDAAA